MMTKTDCILRLAANISAVCLAVALICAPAACVQAGEILQQVKAKGFVRCSGVPRPGLAEEDGSGRWKGIEVDVCRAVAAAVLGSAERVEFANWGAGRDDGKKPPDDILFLTGSEIANSGLSGRLIPGPVIFVESYGILVPENATEQQTGGIFGKGICFMTGSRVERGLEAYFSLKKDDWIRRPFSEDEEMLDAYQARNCSALAGELTFLASMRKERGLDHQASRILPGSLEDFPVMAATGSRDGSGRP